MPTSENNLFPTDELDSITLSPVELAFHQYQTDPASNAGELVKLLELAGPERCDAIIRMAFIDGYSYAMRNAADKLRELNNQVTDFLEK